MAAPVKITCPDIDRYIKNIRHERCTESYLRKLSEPELIDVAISMNNELENCIEYLEELRDSNSKLRSWGEGLESEMEDAAAEINRLESLITE